MAAITITAANVGLGSDAEYQELLGGETIPHGSPVYQSALNVGRHLRAVNDGTAEQATVVGVTATRGTDGGKMIVVTSGTIELGGGVTDGTLYFLGATAGTIVPEGDLVSGNKKVLIGVGVGTTALRVNILNTGATIA